MNQITSLLERAIFDNRRVALALFAIVTALLVAFALQLKFDTNLKKMVPLDHPWIQNMLKYKDDLGLGNDVQIAIEVVDGDIFDPHYLAVVKQVTDQFMQMQGIDASNVKSLWTPNVRWTEVTAEGFQGGNVIPDDYDESPASLEQLRANLLRSGQVGRESSLSPSRSILKIRRT